MEEPNASSVLIYSSTSCCGSPLLNLFVLGRWITFLVAQVVALANLENWGRSVGFGYSAALQSLDVPPNPQVYCSHA